MTVEELKAVLVSMGVDEALITPDAVREEVELDSLGVAELALVLNREQGLPVTEEELHDTLTVADIAALLTEVAARERVPGQAAHQETGSVPAQAAHEEAGSVPAQAAHQDAGSVPAQAAHQEAGKQAVAAKPAAADGGAA